MARNEHLGRQALDLVERHQPLAGVADRQYRKQSVHVDDVPRKQHALRGQPDHHVSRRVPTAA
eukprot:1120-Eustigmatos_ZCMA.PRE.1